MALILGSPNGGTAGRHGRHRLWAGGTQGSETSQYLQEGILRE